MVENKAYLVEKEEELCGGPQKTTAAAARYIDNLLLTCVISLDKGPKFNSSVLEDLVESFGEQLRADITEQETCTAKQFIKYTLCKLR